jgi:hypothetical protein
LPKKLVEAGQEMTAVAAETKGRISPAPNAKQHRHSFAYEQFRNRGEQKAPNQRRDYGVMVNGIDRLGHD